MSTTTTSAANLIDINAACRALSEGKITKEELLAFAMSRPCDSEPLLRLMTEGKLSVQEVSAVITAHRSASAGRQAGALSFKVSEKGAVSIYGLQARFPVTLYGDQWKRLMAHREQLEAFIDSNKSKLSSKPAK